MEIKHLIALVLIVVGTVAGTAAATLSQRIRDLMFFLIAALAVVTERMDVNFLSHEWYRGTTRGVEVSTLDILAISVLVACCLAPRYGGRRWFWPASLAPMLLYLGYCAFSVVISTPRLYGFFELTKVARGIVVFLTAAAFVRTRRELALLVAGLACAAGWEGLRGVEQRLVEGIYRVPGTLDHPNSLSMYLCLVGPVLVAGATADFGPWLRRLCGAAFALAAVTVLLTISRAGVPAFAVAVAGAAAWCGSWRITPRKVIVALALTIAAAGLLYRSWDLLVYRFEQDSIKQEYMSTKGEGRGVYLRWAAEIVKDHPLGVGLNNWSYWVSQTYGARLGFFFTSYADLGPGPYDDATLRNAFLAAPAHNLGALTIGELGVPGFVLFSLVWLRWFGLGIGFLRRRLADPMFRLGTGICFGLVGLFLQSQTEWVYRQTAIFFTCHLLVGTLASLHRHRRLAEAEAPPAWDEGAPPADEEAVLTPVAWEGS